MSRAARPTTLQIRNATQRRQEIDSDWRIKDDELASRGWTRHVASGRPPGTGSTHRPRAPATPKALCVVSQPRAPAPLQSCDATTRAGQIDSLGRPGTCMSWFGLFWPGYYIGYAVSAHLLRRRSRHDLSAVCGRSARAHLVRSAKTGLFSLLGSKIS